jgi:hypothetical protein
VPQALSANTPPAPPPLRPVTPALAAALAAAVDTSALAAAVDASALAAAVDTSALAAAVDTSALAAAVDASALAAAVDTSALAAAVDTSALAAAVYAAAEHAYVATSDERGDAGGQVTESFSVKSAAEHEVEGAGKGVQEDARQALDGVYEREAMGQCEAPSLAVSREEAARQTCTPSGYAVETPAVVNAAAATRTEFVVGPSGNYHQTCDFSDYNMQRPSEGPDEAAYTHTATAPLVDLHGRTERTAAAAHAALALYDDEPPPATSPFLNMQTREVRCGVK